MKQALLFSEREEPILVSAEEVKNGKYSRYDEFVDPEYEFKVQYVKGARNNGGPYFRLYYSREDYEKLYPEKASRYKIIANMRRYKESAWHKKWKENVSDFCTIEKYIKNPFTNKRRFADAFYDKTQTCIEFQHSYIALDFEERNEFYSKLSINTVWLYDLTSADTHLNNQGNIELLENNAKGFFRISEKIDNLKNQRVYIQVKSGKIYRVKDLFRNDSSINKKSTIRYFEPSEIYSEEEFIYAIKYNRIGETKVALNKGGKPKPLYELWDNKFAWIIVKNIESGDRIFINRDRNGEIFRDFNTKCIKYRYVDNKYNNISFERKKEYSLSHNKECSSVWILIQYRKKE